MEEQKLNNGSQPALQQTDVSSSFVDKEAWDALDEDEGGGSYCCGKRMVLAPSEIVYECLKCGAWEYSSS